MSVETFASLRVMGENLDCKQVSLLLGVQPTEVHDKGDPKVIRGAVRGAWMRGLWSLSTEGHVQSEELEVHLEWLLSRLEPHRQGFALLPAAGSEAVDVFCYWATPAGTPGGPTISSRTLSRLGALGIDLDFDFYSV